MYLHAVIKCYHEQMGRHINQLGLTSHQLRYPIKGALIQCI